MSLIRIIVPETKQIQTFKALALIVLFIICSFISQLYNLDSGVETTIRLTTGLAFMIYVFSPYARWTIIFFLQAAFTYIINSHTFAYGLLSAVSESSTAIVSAVVFRIMYTDELISIRNRSILLIFLSAGIGSLIGGIMIHYAFGYFLFEIYHPKLWTTWTFSNLVGIVLMTPIMVEWRSIHSIKITVPFRKSIPELLLLLFTTFLVTHLIFYKRFNDINFSINFPYLILPFIFWAAIRFHPRILSLLLFVESLLILYYTDMGMIVFKSSGQPFQWIVNSIQVFILFTVLFSYIMAGIILTRNEAGEKIRKLNEKLEERVMERTKELQRTLGALQQSEEQFRKAFETSIHGMALISLDGRFQRVNQALCDMLGYSMNDLLELSLRKITQRNDYLSEMRKLKKLINGDISFYQFEKRLIHQQNLEFWVLESNSLIRTAEGEPLRIVSQIVDITEQKQAEGQLRKYTETLTVLLREVNHRVKNNLSALIGMLHMEENRVLTLGDMGYIHVLRDLISRIRGLATVHSMLSARNWQPLEINQLCEQLIQAIIIGLPVNHKVMLNIDQSSLKINSNQAHHLTLVINELATNSVKYGLNDNSNGSIEVKIQELDGKIQLIFRDNGPGYPESMINGDFVNVNIGFELIRGIVTQSLDGELLLRNEGGAVTEILFANELT
jgi:PAS domain S-box-containing protein